MTQEQKARAYDEAREKIAVRFGSNVADEIFCQFEMSEYEKLRKEIISIVKSYRECCISEGNHRFDDCLAWLEKQNEQRYLTGVDLGDHAGDKGCIFNYSNATIPQKDFTPIESK